MLSPFKSPPRRWTFQYLGLAITFFLLMAIYPFFSRAAMSALMLDIILSGMLICSVTACLQQRRVGVLATILVIPALFGRWSMSYHPSFGMVVFNYAGDVVFIAVVIVIFLRDLLRQEKITFDTICGAVCVYMLIGLLWSYFYALLELFCPGSFHFTDAKALTFSRRVSVDTLCDLGYLSFITLTTVGFGDIYPLARPARMLTAIEAIIGQFYMAIMVARAVGLYIAQHAELLKKRRDSLESESRG